jgi:hypothetical protein
VDRSRRDHHRWRNDRREFGDRGRFGSHQGRSPEYSCRRKSGAGHSFDWRLRKRRQGSKLELQTDPLPRIGLSLAIRALPVHAPAPVTDTRRSCGLGNLFSKSMAMVALRQNWIVQIILTFQPAEERIERHARLASESVSPGYNTHIQRPSHYRTQEIKSPLQVSRTARCLEWGTLTRVRHFEC